MSDEKNERIKQNVISDVLKTSASRLVDRVMAGEFNKTPIEAYTTGVQDGMELMLNAIVKAVKEAGEEPKEDISIMHEALKGMFS